MSHRLTLTIIIALALCVAPRAHAQSDRSGRIEGVVFDSVHARPLADVHVVVAGTGMRSDVRAEATSDSAGRFRIDSLPLGRYLVGFESALLDSLEVTLSPREATVTPGNVTQVALAMPSAAKLRAAVCPGVNLSKELGAVYGQVVNAETDDPMAGVTVVLQWRELSVWDSHESSTLRPVSKARLASVTTDDAGWYRACGVPTGTWVSMQLQHEGRVGPVLRTLVDDSLGIGIRHLAYSAASARDSSDFADSTAVLPPLAGSATLTGIVRGPTGAPLPAAQVHVLGAQGIAVTDAQGSFTLTNQPAGTREVEVRRIGYGLTNAWVNLRSGATVKSDVRLERVVNLDSIRVVAVSTRYKEFAAHQKMGLGGIFLGPDRIQRMHFNRTSDIIRGMAGFVVRNIRSGRTRVYRQGGGESCVVNVSVNGFSGFADDPDAFSVDDVNPRDVGAIEVNSGQYGGGLPELDHGCGVIVIWTKR